MTALPQHKMTVDEFYAWAEQQPKEAGKFELHDGVVVMRHGPVGQQQSERAGHWEAKTAIGIALRDAIRTAGLPCFMAIDGPSVRVGERRTFQPDVLVYCGERVPRDALEVPDPLIIVEVLSPGTKDKDHGIKAEGYFSLPSLQHYLIVDPDRPSLIHHRRTGEDRFETRFVHEATLRLDPPGLAVDLHEVLAS
jgi:Uma2 family endonuclease